MRQYPNLWMKDFLRWSVSQRMRFIRPLYWLDYDKERTKSFLAEEFGWKWYGGHHLENRITSFVHTYFWPRRWGIDGRLLGHCALVRSGQMSREQALDELARPVSYDPEIVSLVKRRFNFSDSEFEQLMTQPPKTYRDFPSYKRTFELTRPLWWALYKAHRVPKSFYLKYCFPHRDKPFTGHHQPHLRGEAAIHLESRGALAASAH